MVTAVGSFPRLAQCDTTFARFRHINQDIQTDSPWNRSNASTLSESFPPCHPPTPLGPSPFCLSLSNQQISI